MVNVDYFKSNSFLILRGFELDSPHEIESHHNLSLIMLWYTIWQYCFLSVEEIEHFLMFRKCQYKSKLII